MIKLDLHTHSNASHDGGIRPQQYIQALENGQFDCIAITDHNTIATAVTLHKSLGGRIIVGEEISTTAGDIIGLFLSKAIPAGKSPLATARAIKSQGGLVYIPHPFETIRRGLSKQTLMEIAPVVDIVEVHNGRAVFQNRGPRAATWAKLEHKVMAASSDAHGYKGLGSTYTQINAMPTAKTLVGQLSKGRFITNRPPLRTLLYPKAHRLKKRLGIA
jgi:predicted metal-dependent phosphoesterase TrpH